MPAPPTPDTLPGDFFSAKGNQQPDTLPAGFFNSPAAFQLKPGQTDDEIIRHYGYDPASIKKSHLYTSGAFQKMVEHPIEQMMVPTESADNALGGFAHGFATLAADVGQFATHALNKAGIASDEDKQLVDLYTRVQEDTYRQIVRHGQKTSILPEMAGQALMPVIGARAGLGRLANAVRIAAGGAIIGASQPVEVEGPGGDYFGQKAKQAATGAVIAPLVHGTIVGAGSLLGKVLDRSRNPQIPAAAQEVLDQGQKHGVEGLTYGDVSGSKAAQVVDTTLENIPFTGAGSQRARQQVQVKTAATRVADALAADMNAIPHDGLAQVQAAATKGDKNAQHILDLVNNAGNDPDRAIEASLNLRNFLTSEKNRANYAQVDKLAEQLPDNHVPATRATSTIGNVLNDIKQGLLQTNETRRMERTFDELRENLKGENPYGRMRQLSDQLGAQIDDYYQGPNKVIGAPGVQWLQRVKSAVDQDMQDFTSAAAPNAAPAAAGPAAAAPAAAAAPRTAAAGSATRIPIPNSDRAYDADYQIVERKSVQASHNAQSFEPNPRYGLLNERNYNNPVNQAKVAENSSPAQFDPRQIVNDNPDAINGPTVTDTQGNAIAGNGRKMYLDRAYDADPGSAYGYKDLLAEKSHQFGSTPEAVRAMEEPMLVRRVSDSQFARPGFSKADAIRDMNVPGTAALTPAEQAIADARRVSQSTLDHVAAELETKGTDATLAQVLEGKSGVSVLNKLMQDGVIPRGELAALTTEDALTDAGKKRIQSLMLGRYFRDAGQIDSIAPNVRGKMERIAAPLASIEREGEYSLTPHVKSAIDLLDAQRAHGSKTLDEYLDQSSLFVRQRYSPEAIALARELQTATPNQITDAVRTYGAAAKYAGDYEGPGMFGDIPKPQSPREAFNKAFRTQLAEQPEAAAPPTSPTAPKPSASFNQSFQKQKNSRQQLDALADAGRKADEYYKAERVPFKDRTIGNAVKTDEPDQIYQKFVQAGKGDRAQKFYEVLDRRGQAAVRYGMVANAIERATDSSSGIFSPKKFVTALEKVSDAQAVFFKGKDKFELDGFKNLMAHVTRAGQYAENPPTGQRLIAASIAGQAPAAIGAAFGSASAAAGSLGSVAMIALARGLFTTAAGRNFLLASSSVGPGTRAMNALVNQINEQLPAAVARATAGPGQAQGGGVLQFPSPRTPSPQSAPLSVAGSR